jgi:GntR family transcriptional regulator/MocR family aminotransferase
MRQLYRDRLEVFLDEAKQHLAGFLTFSKIDAGMDAMGWLPRDVSDIAVSKRLSAEGIDAPPLSAYSIRPCAPGLVFGFTAFSPSEIRSAFQTITRSLSH